MTESQETTNALLRQENAALRLEISTLKNQVLRLEATVQTLIDMINNWKGGFLVLVTLGGLFGWVLSIWDKIVAKAH